MKWILLLFAYAPILLSAQHEPCGFMMLQDQIKDDTFAQNKIKEFEINIKKAGKSHYKTEAIITIPIVVHIVWRDPSENLSDDIILSQLDALNRDFNLQNSDSQYVPDEFKPVIGNAAIQFCLAGVDPQGRPTTGIIRTKTDIVNIGISQSLYYDSLGGSGAWDPDNYLNIWVANTGNVVVGIGSLPWYVPKELSGVIVQSSCFGITGNVKYGLGRVCVHEVGHYFGLRHLWGDVYDCSVDDSVPDTPLQGGPYYDCPSYPQNGCNQSAMFMNFMDYADDQCELLFTVGQVSRMRATLQQYRPGIINSNVACQIINSTSDKALTAYPIPTTGRVTVDFSNHQSENLSYEIYNTFGQRLNTGSKLVNASLSIDLSAYPDGIYYFISPHGRVKIIKQ